MPQQSNSSPPVSRSLRHNLTHALWKSGVAAPCRTLAMLSVQNRRFLSSLFHEAAVGITNSADTLTLESIAIHSCSIARYPAVLIEFPPPFQCPEPRLVAMVLNKPFRGDRPTGDLSTAVIDFHTLEEPPGVSGAPVTMFCSHTPDGIHHYHGPGPPPNISAFRQHLRRLYQPAPWWKFWQRAGRSRGRTHNP